MPGLSYKKGRSSKDMESQQTNIFRGMPLNGISYYQEKTSKYNFRNFMPFYAFKF